MTAKQSLLLSCAAAGLSLCASPAFAQPPSDEATVEEVIITAEKREANLQDTPVAVSAYTSRTRELLGITTIQDLTNFTPGLSYSTSLDRASLRGIGRNTNNLASDPGVATYVDGFYNSSTRAAAGSPLFVQRIEVLRGPQGTLYGRNSIGGTINVISPRPTNEWYGEVRGAYASYDRHVIEGVVSGPISENLRFRVGASSTQQDEGYFTNVTGGPSEGDVTDAHYLEAQLEGEIGENFEFWIKGSLDAFEESRRATAQSGDYDFARLPSTYLTQGAAYGLVLNGANPVQAGGYTGRHNPAMTNLRQFAADTTNKATKDDSPTVVGEAVWHMPNMDLKYVGGYSKYDFVLISDYDGTAVQSYTIPLTPSANPAACINTPGCGPLNYISTSFSVYEEHKTYSSNELNLSSTHDGPIQWLAGVYAYEEDYTQPVNFPSGNPQFATPAVTSHQVGAPTLGAPPNPSRSLYYIDTHLRTKSQAVYGQIDWQLNDQFKIAAGLRYTKDEKAGTEFTRQLCFGLTVFFGCDNLANTGTRSVVADVTESLLGTLVAVPNATAPVRDSATGIWSRDLAAEWSATTGTAGLEWTPNDNTLVYGKYSRGYKAGGFASGTIVRDPVTDEEYVDAYEIGLKANLIPSLQTNVSLFYYDYQDMQIPVSVVPSNGPPIVQYFNMNKVVSQGVELEAIWRPLPRLTFLLNYAWLDPIIEDTGKDTAGQPNKFTNSVSQLPENVVGNRVPQSPEHKVALNGNYRFEFEKGSLTTSVSYIWKDETYFAIFKQPYNLAPAYDQVDLRATWTDAMGRYSVVGYVRNAFDEVGYDSRSGGRQNQLPAPSLTNPTTPASIPPGIAISNSLTPPRTMGVEFQYRF